MAAIVLAAGAATRMGALKQLLPYRGQTLLAHSVEQALGAGCRPVVVVSGAESAVVTAAVRTHAVQIVHNDQWQSGMGSSIVAAIRHLEAENPAAVAVLLADQPLVTSHHLQAMARLLENSSIQIVAAQYSGTLGVPALFKRELFPTLVSLAPEAGARHLLQSLRSQIAAYPLPEAAVDIDTPEDFARLVRQE